MSDDRMITRRDALKIGASVGALVTLDRLPAFAASPQSWEQLAPPPGPLIERAIPSTGEKLPIVGIGTARNYERPTPDQIPVLRGVLQKFAELGGKVIDTAPAYGQAEVVVGDALAELKNRDAYFLATKVSIGRGSGDAKTAAAQMEQSLKRLRTQRIDLMQIWNLSSPATIVPVLDEWKAAKRIRYTGITTSSKDMYPRLEEAMKTYKLDFVQIDFAIDNRSAQDRIIPLAAERGMGVLVNLPFGRSRVFQRVLGKPLPDWSAEIDATSWAQIFLKYIVSNPAVTCVIPGTETIAYTIDNNNAARGRLPDASMRKRIEAYFDSLAA